MWHEIYPGFASINVQNYHRPNSMIRLDFELSLLPSEHWTHRKLSNVVPQWNILTAVSMTIVYIFNSRSPTILELDVVYHSVVIVFSIPFYYFTNRFCFFDAANIQKNRNSV